MTAVACAVAFGLVFLLGVLVGARLRYGAGVRHGQRLTELAHGWIPVLVPGVHRRRRWKVLDRKAAEPPGLVERHITPTNERAPLGR